jgi:hypothetical protein
MRLNIDAGLHHNRLISDIHLKTSRMNNDMASDPEPLVNAAG